MWTRKAVLEVHGRSGMFEAKPVSRAEVVAARDGLNKLLEEIE